MFSDLGGMLRTPIVAGAEGGWQRGAWYYDVGVVHDILYGSDDPRPFATEEEVKDMLFGEYVKRVKKASWGGAYAPP